MAEILVIDDSSFARKLIREILKQGDFDVVEAANGREGMDLYKKSAPDAIVLDLLMPDVDGVAVLKELKRMENEAPVVVVSADIQRNTRQTVEELGAFAFLNKPPDPNKLVETIKAALDGSEA
jgi:two-component system, chemotaxis family, chemotaxis protein CheY